MKTTDSEEKKFRQLSDEELEKVNGGGNTVKILVTMCDVTTNPCQPGTMPNPMNNCQCEPMPNTVRRAR